MRGLDQKSCQGERAKVTGLSRLKEKWSKSWSDEGAEVTEPVRVKGIKWRTLIKFVSLKG